MHKNLPRQQQNKTKYRSLDFVLINYKNFFDLGGITTNNSNNTEENISISALDTGTVFVKQKIHK